MTALSNYLRLLWTSRIALRQLLVRDMLLVGTALNVVTGFIAMMLLAQRADTAVAVFLHFATVPYNAFLFLSVWRHPHRCASVLGVSVVWFALMTVI